MCMCQQPAVCCSLVCRAPVPTASSRSVSSSRSSSVSDRMALSAASERSGPPPPACGPAAGTSSAARMPACIARRPHAPLLVTLGHLAGRVDASSCAKHPAQHRDASAHTCCSYGQARWRGRCATPTWPTWRAWWAHCCDWSAAAAGPRGDQAWRRAQLHAATHSISRGQGFFGVSFRARWWCGRPAAGHLPGCRIHHTK